MSTEFESIWNLHVPRLMAATIHAQQQVTQDLEMHEKLAAKKPILLERFASKKFALSEIIDATKLAMADHATRMEEEDFMTGDFAAAGGLAAGEFATMKEEDARHMEELALENIAMAEEQALNERAMEDIATEERDIEERFTKALAELRRDLHVHRSIAMRSHVIAEWVILMLVDLLLESGVFIDYFDLLQLANHLASLSQNHASIQNIDGPPSGTWKGLKIHPIAFIILNDGPEFDDILTLFFNP